MNTYTVDYLENEVRDMERTIEGLAQERTELEDALRRLIYAIEDALVYLESLPDYERSADHKAAIEHLQDALKDEGCGSTE